MGKTVTVTVKELRVRLAEVLGRAAYGGQVFTVTRNGRPVARIGPPALAANKAEEGAP